MFVKNALKFSENVLTSIDKKASELNKRDNKKDESKFKNGPPGVLISHGGASNFKKQDDFSDPPVFNINNQKRETRHNSFSEREKELKKQIQSLLSEKLENNNRFTKSLEEKEKNFERVIERLSAKDELLSSLQKEKDDMIQTHRERVSELSDTIIDLNKEIVELKRTKKEKNEEYEKEKERLRNEIISIRKEMGEVEREYMKLQNEMQQKEKEIIRIKDLHKLKERDWIEKENENNRYKIRVQNIIKEKNKEIQNSKNGSKNDENSTIENNEDVEVTDFQFEIENLKNEVKEYTAKLNMQKRERENLEFEFNNYKKTTNRHLAIKDEEIQEKLLMVKDLKNKTDAERLDFQKKIRRINEMVKEKETETFELQKKINELQNSHGYEKKLRNLTESVLQKEERIQTLMSEKLALNLRLEKETNKVKELSIETKISETPRKRGINGVEDTIIELPSFPTEKKKYSIDNNQPAYKRILKNIVSIIDNIGIKNINHLRKNSNHRVAVVIYAFFIHLIFIYLFFKTYF